MQINTFTLTTDFSKIRSYMEDKGVRIPIRDALTNPKKYHAQLPLRLVETPCLPK